MELLKRQPILLSLLVILLSCRFIVVPIIDWQNQSLEQTQGLQKKQQKTEIAIHREADNQEQLQVLEKQNIDFQALFFIATSETKFKLERQQWLEALLAKHNLKGTNIGWSNSSNVINTEVIKHSLQLRLEGNASDLPKFQYEIESTEQWIEINNFTVFFRKQINLNLGRIRASYQINFYQLTTDIEESTYD